MIKDKELNILLAAPRGFCAGVDRAVRLIHNILNEHGAPVYVRHEIVHNQYIVDSLRSKGAVFVDELDSVPEGAVCVFSAHGVARRVYKEAEERGLRVYDATCPLVSKVHNEINRYLARGLECILIGHSGHPEVEGILGQQRDDDPSLWLVENVEQAERIDVRDPDQLAYVTQTTLSMDDTADIIAVLRRRFPRIIGPNKNDICYATQNRQNAAKVLASQCQLVLVIGSHTSSNANRLVEVIQKTGTPAYLIDQIKDINTEWLEKVDTIGITAGASTPEILVEHAVEHIRSMHRVTVKELQAKPETVHFALPTMLDTRLSEQPHNTSEAS